MVLDLDVVLSMQPDILLTPKERVPLLPMCVNGRVPGFVFS